MKLIIGIIVPTLMVAGSAGADEKDLRRRLASQKAGVEDLEKLDEHRVATAEIGLLRSWLDEAWTQLGQEEEDLVRLLLDRCDVQSEYVRKAIDVSKTVVEADATEKSLADLRAKLAKVRKDFEQANVKKKALEMNLR